MRRLLLTTLLMFCIIAISAQKAGTVIDDATVQKRGVEAFFSADTISDATFQRMRLGGSYPEGCSIARNDLRYLRVLHRNFDGNSQTGEFVCNKAIASKLLTIFRSLYDANYQICRMVLIDEYGADDETSMRANNTSCFCYRVIKGSTKLSKHSQGLAIDINPLQNPCVKYRDGKIRSVQPNTQEARRYANRTMKAHVITANDLCLKLFRQQGFTWGGSWRTTKDYQHFEMK